MEKLKSELDRLLWIIDFINLDIDSLKKGDFYKLFVELNETVRYLPFSLDNEGKNSTKDPWFPLGKGKSIKSDNNKIAEDSSENRGKVKTLQTRIRNLFELIYEGLKSEEPQKIVTFRGIETFIVGRGHISHIKAPENRELFELEIAHLIFSNSGVWRDPFSYFRPLNSLKKCQAPGCDNFFWQVHKKEKNFCSNKCAWRAYAKAKRDKEKKNLGKSGKKMEKAQFQDSY